MASLQEAWAGFYDGHLAPTMTPEAKADLSAKWNAFMRSWDSFYTVAKNKLRVAESVNDIEGVDEEFLESACQLDASEKGNYDEEWCKLADIYCEVMKVSIGLGETQDQGLQKLESLNRAGRNVGLFSHKQRALGAQNHTGPLTSDALPVWSAEYDDALGRMLNVAWSRTGPLPKSGSCTGTHRRCQVTRAVKQVISKQTKTTASRFGFSYQKVWTDAELTTYYGDKYTKWAGLKTKLTMARTVIKAGLTIGALFDPSGTTTAVNAVLAALGAVAAEFVNFKSTRAESAFYASCQPHCMPEK